MFLFFYEAFHASPAIIMPPFWHLYNWFSKVNAIFQIDLFSILAFFKSSISSTQDGGQNRGTVLSSYFFNNAFTYTCQSAYLHDWQTVLSKFFIYSSLWALSRSCNSDILLHSESFFISSFASLSLSLSNSSEYNMIYIAFALCSCLSWHIFSHRLQVYHIKRDLSWQ